MSHSHELETLLVSLQSERREYQFDTTNTSLYSKRIRTLRRQLGISTVSKKGREFKQKSSNDPRYAFVLLFQAERALAHAAACKSQDKPNVKGWLRKLRKAIKHVDAFHQFMFDQSQNVFVRLQAEIYSSIVSGDFAFQRKRYMQAAEKYAVARVGLEAVQSHATASSHNDMRTACQELIASIDPALRYAAYQVQRAQTTSSVQLALQYLPSEHPARNLIEQLDPSVLQQQDPDAKGNVITVEWRNRSVEVKNIDIAVALSRVNEIKNAVEAAAQSGEKQAKTLTLFDELLSAWSEASTAVQNAISEATKSGMNQRDFQQLQIINTWTSFNTVTDRIRRDSMLCTKSHRQLQQPQTRKPSVKRQVLHDLSVLYEIMARELRSIFDLPGVSSDETLTADITAKVNYLDSLRVYYIAQSHSEPKHVLALLVRAKKYLLDAQAHFEQHQVLAGALDLTKSDFQEYQKQLESEIPPMQALATLKAKSTLYTDKSLISTPHLFRPDVDLAKDGYHATLDLKPTPAKPILYDIAYNFIGQAEVETPKAAEPADQQKPQSERKGFLKSLWGR